MSAPDERSGDMGWKRREIPEYRHDKIERLIDLYVHKDRDRLILKERYLNRTTYEEIAEKFQMSDRHMKNIDYRFQQNVLLPHRNELL